MLYRIQPHKTKTPEIGLFWRKTKHDPVVAMKYVNDGPIAPLIQKEKITASQKTPLMTGKGSLGVPTLTCILGYEP